MLLLLHFWSWLDNLGLFNKLQTVLRLSLETQLLRHHLTILQVLFIDELLEHDHFLLIGLAFELLKFVLKLYLVFRLLSLLLDVKLEVADQIVEHGDRGGLCLGATRCLDLFFWLWDETFVLL